MQENKESVYTRFVKLMSQVNYLLAMVAVLVVCVLVFIYFQVGYLISEDQSLNEKLSIDLALGLITNIIPVFLVFLGSWFFIKEIRSIEKKEDRRAFSNDTASDILKKIQPLVESIESRLIKEIRTFSGFRDGIVDLLKNGNKKDQLITSMDIYAMSAGTFMDNLLHGKELKDAHMRVILPTSRAIEVYYNYYNSMVSKDPGTAVVLLQSQIRNTTTKLRDFKEEGNLLDYEIRYVDMFPSFYLAIANGSSNLFGYYYANELNSAYGLKLGPVNVLHPSLETTEIAEANSAWFNGMWESAHSSFDVNPVKYFTVSAYSQDANICLKRYYDLAAKHFEKSYEGFSLKKDDFSLIVDTDLQRLKSVFREFGKGCILDAGCGPGFWISYYKNEASSITLLDVSIKMLDAAKTRVAALKDDLNAEVNFLEKNILEMDANDHKSYNTIFLSFVLSHYTDEDILAIFEKLSRMLYPGGSLVVVDSIFSDYVKIRNKKEVIKSLISHSSVQVYKRYFEKDEISNLAHLTGFTCSPTYSGNFFAAYLLQK